jgi:hypothetical protein
VKAESQPVAPSTAPPCDATRLPWDQITGDVRDNEETAHTQPIQFCPVRDDWRGSYDDRKNDDAERRPNREIAERDQ